ncbi:TIGR03862 family flavoprotein [Agrobacterium vitis]|uniref:TIGR03862 family flavoprotein n=1 Tax=Agrobacterium vitis TaxID=373 RepID=UPI001572307F|nr:TIGR03862 family flavoprotein [Agrobacterium vitis]NSZ18246.1 TIGR03862 family flavoprotein [Agrobacterium vitis]QZO03964.1 TIGR03862 family flavoprotein [Agrobacterium vitis]UJL89092.1 TIGR03862 family flavoprotein [Agrobacterium vitis]BCH57803.1 dehydrogenase [Agrobacterium vitis]
MAGKTVAIIGGGPAGLMAADSLSLAGLSVTIYEAMPTLARKFLLAGKSGLNITHSEEYVRFSSRFGEAGSHLKAALDDFMPDDVRAWAADLGTETFIGSSGRVFPKAMKASPLLRAWIKALQDRGVMIRTRHRWTGFSENGYRFATPDGDVTVMADAVVLALGGASWPRLGSDAAWVPWLRDTGVAVTDFKPANCGFDIAWSDVFRERFAGQPVKSVVATSAAGQIQGEFVISRHGIEGSLIYAHAAALRDDLRHHGKAELLLDLAPGKRLEKLAEDLARQPAKASLSTRLRKAASLDGVKAALLREVVPDIATRDATSLAGLIKALPVSLLRPRPLAEAISSAGGVNWSGIDSNYMLVDRPGLFLAGEMLDWEAPTGGYLLTACFATGRAAAVGVIRWLTDDAGD